MNCDTARIYCGAVADGELDLLPAAVLQHIRVCHDCTREVGWQAESQAAVKRSLTSVTPSVLQLPSPSVEAPRRWRLGLGLGAVATAAAALFLAAPLLGPHPMPVRPASEVAMVDAVHAYGAAAAFSSTDTDAISGWSAGRGMPTRVVGLPGQTPTGARVSTIQGHQVVTLIYAGARGTTEVTVLPASMTSGWPAMEATRVESSPVGLVRNSADGMIVVTSDDGALHSAMTALQGS